DTARVPYGTKSPETVIRYSRNNARFLLDREVKLLVVACNTATAHALPTLRAELPVPVIGVVEPGVEAAVAAAGSGRIGVIGTAGTIASGAYQRALAARAPGAWVVARACPLFVPFAEEGWTRGEVPEAVAERYLGDLRGAVDALVLGCTHYPLLRGTIAKVLGPEVALVDSGTAAANAVAARLEADGRLSADPEPEHRIYVTDVPANFPAVAAQFLGASPPAVEQVDV
ncbi:MAG TPA: glutamate racemase, partial [Vulgatibacter sp.]|nr:glutamate racemase [Vulgatibacter sp.]